MPLLVLLAATTLASEALAEPEQVLVAREHYARGEQLFAAGDYVGALRRFRAAYRAAPHPVVLKSQAECESRLGNHRVAVELYERYLRERPDATDRAEVEARMAELRARPGRLRVESDPPGAQIVVDGRLHGATTPAVLDLLPGSHSVELRLEGHEPSVHRAEVAFDAESTISTTLSAARLWAAEPDFGEVSTPPAEASAPARDRLRLSPATWAAIGFCAAGLVTGTVAGSLALSDQSRFDDGVASGTSRGELESIGSRGRAAALAADVGFAVGLVAGLTGVVLFVLDLVRGTDDGDVLVAPSRRGGPGLALSASY